MINLITHCNLFDKWNTSEIKNAVGMYNYLGFVYQPQEFWVESLHMLFRFEDYLVLETVCMLLIEDFNKQEKLILNG